MGLLLGLIDRRGRGGGLLERLSGGEGLLGRLERGGGLRGRLVRRGGGLLDHLWYVGDLGLKRSTDLRLKSRSLGSGLSLTGVSLLRLLTSLAVQPSVWGIRGGLSGFFGLV